MVSRHAHFNNRRPPFLYTVISYPNPLILPSHNPTFPAFTDSLVPALRPRAQQCQRLPVLDRKAHQLQHPIIRTPVRLHPLHPPAPEGTPSSTVAISSQTSLDAA